MKPPAYFENVRKRAADRWRQLEADRELAGPWHQLFRQVQSPRHVLSELLQNADDAGARKASVQFAGETFVFEHDGADFTEDQFASLCRFGFSNKRSLHTIGFRGIGFKSTFSLGSAVEVFSPTLAVRFHEQRFTEPEWIDGSRSSESTMVRVKVAKKDRGNQLRISLEEWTESPSSLLFFKNLRELSIDGSVVRKRVTRRGPVERSQFLNLSGEETERLFFVQSEAEALPEDAAEEIRGERGLADLEELHLPPCKIEIVLGLNDPQRLYVVLPTGAEIPVPFSINAPFIQDPARMKIKDPATSPTNRWLLERAGRLLAQTFVDWVGNKELSLVERARAYELLSHSTDFDTSLGGQCAEIIFGAFNESVENQRIVLATSGAVSLPGETIAVPSALHEIWEPSPLCEIFGASEHRHVVASEVAATSVEAMANREWITALAPNDIILRLAQDADVPRPRGWDTLQKLWEFISAERASDYYTDNLRELRLVPVQGDKVLHAANGAVRLSSKRDQLGNEDWEFLLAHTRSVAPDWIAWVSKLPPTSESGRSRIARAMRLLQRLGLHEPTPVDRVVAQAFTRLIAPGEAQIADCVRMAQIMAALSAKIPEGFQFVTRDCHLRQIEHGVVWEDLPRVEAIVPVDWAESHFLHATYDADYVSCTREQWKLWTSSPASGLHTSTPIEKANARPSYRSSVAQIAEERGGHKPAAYHYRRDSFWMEDFDLPEGVSKALGGAESAAAWAAVLETILLGPAHEWKEKLETTIHHEGNQYRQKLDCGSLRSKWLHRFRSLPGLSDTFGKLHVPADLLLRTPDTEPLMGIELFVRADLDVPANRPLLRALGVRDNPADPHKILDRLRGLSRAPNAARVITEVAKLYEALDRVVARMASAQLAEVTRIFAEEDLILSDAHEWVSAGEVSIFGDPEASAPGIHAAVQRLAMWPRVNVSERPAIEKTIEWLQTLEPGRKLEPSEIKRIRQVLQREPSRIWHTCGSWVSLLGTWEKVDGLKFRLAMQELTKWSELSPAVKKATADLRMLAEEMTRLDAFGHLRNLSEAVEFRATRCEGASPSALPEWLDELAAGLCRVRLGSEEETQRVRNAAQRLRSSTWRQFSRIEVTPYVDGDPAGEPTSPKAFWTADQFYAANLPTARLHKDLADEISRPFAQSSITAAVAACIERDREFVREYLADVFKLDAELPEAPRPQPAEEPESGNGEPPAGESETEAEDDLNDEDDTDSEKSEEESTRDPDGTAPRPRRPESPHTPSLIERYAQQRGFRWQAQAGQFVHRDGRRIAKDEQPFHWAEHRADGELHRRLWLCEQRLSHGIEVAHELWQTIKNDPDNTAIVSPGENSAVNALTGAQLIEKRSAGSITIHPASYRLVIVAASEGNGADT
jgi:hypothetical protein